MTAAPSRAETLARQLPRGSTPPSLRPLAELGNWLAAPGGESRERVNSQGHRIPRQVPLSRGLQSRPYDMRASAVGLELISRSRFRPDWV